MYLLYLSKSAEPANFLSSSHYPAWLYVVLHKHTLRKPSPNRDWCPKVTKEQDPHQGCLLTDSQAPWLRINPNLLQSQFVITVSFTQAGTSSKESSFLICLFYFVHSLSKPFLALVVQAEPPDLHWPKTLSICVSSVSTLPCLYHYSNFSFLAAYHNWVPKQAWDPGTHPPQVLLCLKACSPADAGVGW